MATGYHITAHLFSDGLIVYDEPLGLFTDDVGDVFIITAKPIEVPGDPSKATEVIGNVPSPDQLSQQTT